MSVFVAAVLAAACGGAKSASDAKPAPSADAKAVLLAAVQSTTGERTAHVAMTLSFGGGKLGNSQGFTGSGEVDFARKAVALELTPDATGKSGIELRLIDGTLYFNEAGSWAIVSTTNLGATGPGLVSYDPNQTLDDLRTISSEPRTVGADTLRGVATTHCRSTFDQSKLIDALSLPPAVAGKFKNAKPSDSPIDAGIDAQGNVRKVGFDLRVLDFHFTTTVEFFDFGTPVSITAPACCGR
jgi:opacity protein-like surface antigen